jgi:hypothetical protein
MVRFAKRSSGLDASIGFETDRAENLGKVFPGENFVNRTIIGVSRFRDCLFSYILGSFPSG